jgi:hypothetical protein
MSNHLRRFVERLFTPSPAPAIKEGPTRTNMKVPDHKAPRPPSPMRQRPPGAILYVALWNGFLTHSVDPDTQADVYGIDANIRNATPFRSFGHANTHAGRFVRKHAPADAQYFAVIRPA